MSKETKKRFKLFDLNRDGKGVEKDEDRRPTFVFFFKLLFRKFTNLIRLNLMMLVQILPIIIVGVIYLLGDKTPSATNPLFAPVYGIDRISNTLDASATSDLVSAQMGLPVFTPLITCSIIVLCLFLAVTWGWQNVGATYVLRAFVRGDGVFIFSDFFRAIKRNMKQGLILGLIDFFACLALVVDFSFFYYKTGEFVFDLMYFAIFALVILYFVMRFYIYLLLITFDMKTLKILKHALIFSILGIKRNILAFLGIAFFLALHIALIILLVPMGISLPLVIPLVYIMSFTAFMSTYAAYPVIDKYMIAPYSGETTSHQEDDDILYPVHNDEFAEEI